MMAGQQPVGTSAEGWLEILIYWINFPFHVITDNNPAWYVRISYAWKQLPYSLTTDKKLLASVENTNSSPLRSVL